MTFNTLSFSFHFFSFCFILPRLSSVFLQLPLVRLPSVPPLCLPVLLLSLLLSRPVLYSMNESASVVFGSHKREAEGKKRLTSPPP